MINEESLEKDIYEYLKYCREEGVIRGVGIVTDYQYIFYSQLLKDDYAAHESIVMKLEDYIHPDDVGNVWASFRDNHVYIFSWGKKIDINLPADETLSTNQYKFLCGILDDIDKFNREVTDDRKVKIDVYTSIKGRFDKYNLLDVKRIKDELLTMVTREIKIENQKVIGKTLDEKDIKESILFNIGLRKSMTIKELLSSLNMCKEYYDVDYYHNTFCNIFSNYLECLEMIKVLYQLYGLDFVLNEISFETMFNILRENIKNKFNSIMDYDEIYTALNIINNNKNNYIKELFPNSSFVIKYMRENSLNSEEKNSINLLLKEAVTYEDKVRVIIKFIYEKVNNSIIEEESMMEKMEKDYEYINTGKRIIANKEKLNSLINRYREIDDYGSNFSIELSNINIESQISINKNNITSLEKILESYSSSFFKRVWYRKKIKDIEDNLEKIRKNNIELNDKISKSKKKQEENDKELADIEKEFKEITGFDFIPFDVASMEYYYNKDYLEEEKNYINMKNYYGKEILNLKEKINDIVNSGLLDGNIENSIKRTN